MKKFLKFRENIDVVKINQESFGMEKTKQCASKKKIKHGKFYPMSRFQKCMSTFFAILALQLNGPLNVLAMEMSKAEQQRKLEQQQRKLRTSASEKLNPGKQSEIVTQKLIKTCYQIINNLKNEQAVEEELNDIEEFKNSFDGIYKRTIEQMAKQKEHLKGQGASEKLLQRLDNHQKKITKKFAKLAELLKNVTSNKKDVEKLKVVVRALALFLEKSLEKNKVTSKDNKKATPKLSRRSEVKGEEISLLDSFSHNVLLTSTTDSGIGNWLSELNEQNVSGQGTAADLAATDEIYVNDPELIALAESLDKHPLKIYEYLRNEFVYEPYWGSVKGAKRTFIEKAGNDIDLASLFITLLRISNRHARYVCGSIEMTVEEAAAWIGVDDPTQVVKTFIANGIPVETTTKGGKIDLIRMNHTWVQAYIDFIPYHGATNETPNTWVWLDVSFKQNTFTSSRELETTIGINPDTLLTNVIAQTDVDADNFYAQNIPESYILSEIFSYGEPIRSYLGNNNFTAENVFRQRIVKEERYGIVSSTDQYAIINSGLNFNVLPEELCSTVTFTMHNMDNSEAFSYTTKLSELANKTISVNYIPASEIDAEMIELNADEVDFPAYLVNLKSQLNIGGVVVGEGDKLGMGLDQKLEVIINIPGLEPDISSTLITAGSMNALVFDFQTTNAELLSMQQKKLQQIAQSTVNIGRNEAVSEILHGIGLSYFYQLDRFSQIAAGSTQVSTTRQPSLVKIGWDYSISYNADLPYLATLDKINLDVIRDIHIPVAIEMDNTAAENQFTYISALTGVILEHNVLAQPFNNEAISAARIIQKANAEGKKIYTITPDNANEILPLLNLFPAKILNDIKNAVNANIEVTIPEAAIHLNGKEYYAYAKRDIINSNAEFVLNTRGGGEASNNSLQAIDMLVDGNSGAYKMIAQQLSDWLIIAEDSTTNAGLAYLPAITAIRKWNASREELDPVTINASILALSTPITSIYNQPAILNVVTGEKLIAPNGNGIKDSFDFSAIVTQNSEWTWKITDSQDAIIITETGNNANVNFSFDQLVPDGTYSYRLTAEKNGVFADPISGTFRVDTTAPVAAITLPDPTVEIKDHMPITLRGTADDINFEKVIITVQSQGEEPLKVYESNDITVNNILTSISTAEFENGPLHITMAASDKAGNVTTVNKTYTINNPILDTVSPTVAMVVNNSADNAIVAAGAVIDAESKPLNITINATDTLPGKVAKINLYHNEEIIKTIDFANELNFSMNTISLNDGIHTLQAEAIDTGGNITKTEPLEFTLSNPISNFRVSPNIAKTTTPSMTVSATLRQAANWELSFTGPSTIADVTGNGTSIMHSFTPSQYTDGEYTVTLTVDDKNPELQFIIDMVQNPPIAVISNIAVGQIIQDGLYELRGTADDHNISELVEYSVKLLDADGQEVAIITPKPHDESGWKEGRVVDSSFGTLDFSMLKNNSYTLQLAVRSGGQVVYNEVKFMLNSQLKIGQLSFSQQDLVIPVNGMPISVIRTYNSFNTAYENDFGPGWTYSIKDMDVEFSEQRQNANSMFGGQFSLRTGGGRDVTVTMPDGERLSFKYSLRSSGEYYKYKAYWEAASGTQATLEPTCVNTVVALPGVPAYWEAGQAMLNMEHFDIPGFILTTKDGTKYHLEREHYGDFYIDVDDLSSSVPYVSAYGKAVLKRIVDKGGNRIEFNQNGINAYNVNGEKTRSIAFERDSNNQNRITAVYAPDGVDANGDPIVGALPKFTYDYDVDNGNLIKVNKLIDNSGSGTYATTEFVYGNANRPHFITEIKDPSGNTPMMCEYDNDGRLVATVDADGNRIQLQRNIADRTETVFDRSGNATIHSYDTRGNVTSSINSMGYTITRTYDSNDNETSITDALGNTTYYTYDGSKNRTSVTDPLGNVTRYTYDSSGNQLTTIDALGNVTRNTYDNSGNLLTTINALGQITTNKYDSNGNLVATYDAKNKLTASFGYDSQGNMNSITDAAGVTRNFSYDGNGLQTGTSFVWNGNGSSKTITTQTVYNSADQVIRTVDPDGNVSTTEYNAIEKPVSSTDKLGNTTLTVYDARGNVVETKHADGTVSRTVYDVEGRGYLTQNRHVLGTSANGSRTIYDSLGRAIRSERLEGVEVNIVNNEAVLINAGNVVSNTSTVYDANGRVLVSIDEKGNQTRYEYDAAGRTTAVIDALGNRIENVYDANGQQIISRDALGREVSYEYDALGRRVRTTFADGTYATVEYNALGQKVRETDQSGVSTRFEYDEMGRLAKVIKPQVENSSGTMTTPEWNYDYNQYGQMEKITDPLGRETTFTYDEYGRQLSRTLPMGQTESQEYNTLGQLVKQINFAEEQTSYVYDQLGRTSMIEYRTSGASPPAETVTIVYDELGRKSQIVESRGTTEYSYDSESRVTQIMKPEGTINYVYDPVTSRKVRMYTANSDQRYTYDELGRLKTVAVHKNNGVALGTVQVTSYNYTVVGSRESTVLPNGVKTNYTYDNLNRLTQLAHYDSNNDLLQSFNYSLAPTGRRTAIAEQRRETSGNLSTTNIAFTYDAMNRLVAESSSSDVTSLNYSNDYVYDLNGNRLQKVSSINGLTETINYQYNANDKLTTEVSSDKGTISYSYNANGSLISKIGQGESYQYSYNLQNRMATAQISRVENAQDVSVEANYVYDMSGIRVKASHTQTVSGNTLTRDRYFLTESGFTGYDQILEEATTLGGSPVKSYVLGDDVISQTVNGVTSHLLYDGHGSTRLLTGNDGVVSDRYDFDAYGVMLGGNPDITNPAATDLLYSGEQFDSTLQQQYLRARYYDQNSGRFNRQDPFAGNNDDPQSLHKYAYCHSDPINATDPSGEMILANLLGSMKNLGMRYVQFQRSLVLHQKALFSLRMTLAIATGVASGFSNQQFGPQDISDSQLFVIGFLIGAIGAWVSFEYPTFSTFMQTIALDLANTYASKKKVFSWSEFKVKLIEAGIRSLIALGFSHLEKTDFFGFMHGWAASVYATYIVDVGLAYFEYFTKD
ncbi:RHS repeat-associated core domain-containing protein [Lentisphaerota bacterium WC36G]|nr:hypothetical protein LJT99_01870 [Lentisphaerae bacterium WC36]